MAQIDNPEFPVIAWKYPINPDYTIYVERNAVVKTVKLSPDLETDADGNYLIYGYGFGDFNPLLTNTHHTAAVIAEALTLLFTSSLVDTNDGRTPEGGFNLAAGTVTGFYEIGLSDKSFPTVKLSVSISAISTIPIDVNFLDGGVTNEEYKQFGFTGPLGPGRSFTVLGIGSTRTISADYPGDGLWAPNNYICYEDRNFQRDTIINSSAFDTSTYRVENWSTNRELMVLSYPVVGAEFIFEYRRADSRFSIFTIPEDPNNLLENLFVAAQEGQVFNIYWSTSIEVESFSIQDESYVQDFKSQLTDASGRGRLWDIVIPFVKQ
jgi:hypothetical protein